MKPREEKKLEGLQNQPDLDAALHLVLAGRAAGST